MLRSKRLLVAGLLLAVSLEPAAAATHQLSQSARWLQSYIRIDTTNPPGHEGKSAAFLAAILHHAGIATETIVSASGRQSLYARIAANQPSGQGALVLLHHMDVVPAGDDWTVPPFSGLILHGDLWGRGAIDDKSLGVAELAAFLDVAKSHRPRHRDLIFLAVADEESGGGQGTAWIFSHHPELLHGVTAVINEGGSNRRINGHTLWWGIEVAQKRPLWLKVTTHGRGGHSSTLEPYSAIHKLVGALDRLLKAPPIYHVCPAARRYFEALAPLHNAFWRKIFLNLDQEITPQGPRSALMPGMAGWFLDTIQITQLEAGDRINVIPDSASAKIDIRLLPDTNEKAFLAKVKKALGPEAEVKVLLTAPIAAASPTSGPLWRAFEKVLRSSAPIVPAMISGFTDSRYFRERGIAAYGFSPFELAGKDLRGIHAANEHIPIAAFDRGVERMKRVILDAVTGTP